MNIPLRFPTRQLLLSAFTVVFLALLAVNAFSQQGTPRQLVQGSSAPVNARRIALVIGNGAYTNAPALKNPPNDARDMAATLTSLGFDVSRGVNVGQRELKRLIREFGQKLKGGGNGLFYYAGHGVQARGRNYIIPVDAVIQSEADVEDSGVDVGLVLNYMDDAQNGLNIVILDACRNNPFARSFRSASEGLAQVEAPTGTLIAYATAPGKVAADGVGDNGLYTSELLKAMRLPGLSATDMFMQVRAEVMKRTASKQVPWESSSLVGAFYFSGAPTEIAVAKNPSSEQKFDPAAFEYSYWETIKTSTNADDFKAYLTRYPTGQFVELANNRIKALEVVAKPAEPPPVTRDTGGATEIAFWDSVKNSTSVDDFRAYLKKYPNGEFVELANNRLRALAKPPEPAKPVEKIQSWRGTFGVKSATLGFAWQGTLKVGEKSVNFHCDGNDKFCKAGEVRPFDCAELANIVVEKNFIREIAISKFKYRFTFDTAAEANSAFAAIKQAHNQGCSPSQTTSTPKR